MFIAIYYIRTTTYISSESVWKINGKQKIQRNSWTEWIIEHKFSDHEREKEKKEDKISKNHETFIYIYLPFIYTLSDKKLFHSTAILDK